MRLIRSCSGALLAVFLWAGGTAIAAAAERFPGTIALPAGWLPEGIVGGRGTLIYSGSRANGAIYAADVRTGEGRVLVPGQTGRVAVGIDYEPRRGAIFVAGGATGTAWVHDADTGATLGTFPLATGTPTFVNDVVVTRDAAFTDSNQPVIYRLPLGHPGTLPAPGVVERIVLSGDYRHVSGLNLNGIVATPDGRTLIAVHSTLGVLYRIDPATGIAETIDLDGASLTNGDGLMLRGDTLHVVRNRLNEVVVIDLDPQRRSGKVSTVVRSPDFDVPTTIAGYGTRLYVVNARFTTPATPSTPYDIVQVPRARD